MIAAKTNVLLMLPSFHQGGSERQAVQLARLLHESGLHRVHVACLDKGGLLRAEVEGLGLGDIPEYPLTSFYDRNALTQLRRCIAFLREHEIDVVQTFDLYTNVFGMAAAALARVPARIAARRELEGIRSPAQKWIERRAYNLAHKVVANAEAIRGRLIEDGVAADKISTIYNSLDLRRVAPQPGLPRDEALAVLDLPRQPSRRFITIVANVQHPVKDHRMFLRAAKLVRATIPDAAFVIAGEGELLDSLREYAAQLGLARDVFFTGRCVKVAELLFVSDVCVLSSVAEGLSNSILEYMAAARPVVVTDVGGAREAVSDGESGYIVKPGDDETMAARIIALLQDPERARAMGERGRHIVEQKFSCEANLARTQNLYDGLLKGTPRLSVQALRAPRTKA
ncbi:MAG: glycosyltransferase family 4 protein [Pyrinomonadaceae bacterium]